ncbi:MAG: sigma-70 family RNA polymerase sigma factor [Armatimonadetes bacterium]|nr:sigma-70 family RNA polymerase sigma factor [Armatimonadota bacterium]
MPTASKCRPERWLEEHGDALFRFALARLRDSTLAEDMVQEALLGALRSQDNYEGRAEERTWLISILRRKIADCLRRMSRRPKDQETPDFDETRQFVELPDIWSDPELALESDAFRVQFRDCLGRLPDDFADAFILREVEELTYEEVCDMLGVTATNLSTRLYRARMLLRKCLQTNWFDDRSEGR